MVKTLQTAHVQDLTMVGLYKTPERMENNVLINKMSSLVCNYN